MSQHEIYFDHSCRLCENSVRWIQERDSAHIFIFYPLASQKAKHELPESLLRGDTLVLKESDGRIWVRSKAIFRILKHLGGKWAWLGFFAYVPGLNLFYRIIAKHRR